MSDQQGYAGPIKSGMKFERRLSAPANLADTYVASERTEHGPLRKSYWPVRPADSDTDAWAAFVPDGPLPTHEEKAHFRTGQIYAVGIDGYRMVFVVTEEGARPDTATARVLAGRDMDGDFTIDSSVWSHGAMLLFPAPVTQQAAPAVERALADGWQRRPGRTGATTCGRCFRDITGAGYFVGNLINHCDACAERRGAFDASPPVKERKLAPGWVRRPVVHCIASHSEGAPCRFTAKHTGVYYNSDLELNGACEASAEFAGVFADTTPAPRPATEQKCDHRTNAKCIEPGGCEMVRSLKASTAPARTAKDVKPAPVAKPPRCEYRKSAHEGTPVERVMMFEGATRRMFACDACYLFSEAGGPEEWRGRAGTAPVVVADSRPRARVGLVPQVFGLSAGILSRGMAK